MNPFPLRPISCNNQSSRATCPRQAILDEQGCSIPLGWLGYDRVRTNHRTSHDVAADRYSVVLAGITPDPAVQCPSRQPDEVQAKALRLGEHVEERRGEILSSSCHDGPLVRRTFD